MNRDRRHGFGKPIRGLLEQREGLVVRRDDRLEIEEPATTPGCTRAVHGKMSADGNDGKVRLMQLGHPGPVGHDVGIAGDIQTNRG